MGDATPPDDGGGEDASTNEGDGVLEGQGEKILAVVAGYLGINNVDKLETLLANPEQIIEKWFMETLIFPLVNSISRGLQGLVKAILTLAWGADREPFLIPPEGEIGILDFPLYVAELIIGVFGASVTEPVEGIVKSFNGFLIGASGNLGLAGPLIIPMVWVGMVGVAVYAMLFAARTVDVPLVDQGPALDALTAPAKRFVRWLTE